MRFLRLLSSVFLFCGYSPFETLVIRGSVFGQAGMCPIVGAAQKRSDHSARPNQSKPAEIYADGLDKPIPYAIPLPAQRDLRPTVEPLPISRLVTEANRTRKVEPSFPLLAKLFGVSGRVEFSILINKEGRVEQARLVSGNPLLVAAAREAVLQWVYRPISLNGRPVTVITAAVVGFAS